MERRRVPASEPIAAAAPRRRALLAWPPLGFVLIAPAFLACFLFWMTADAETMERLAREGGPIEMTTAVAWGFAIAALLAAAPREPGLFVGSAFAAGLLLARELDLHRITSQSALALNSYQSGGMPPGERMAAGAVVLALAAILVGYVIRYAPRLWRALSAGRAEAWTIAAILLLLAYSASIDGLHRKARDFLGVELPLEETKRFLGAFEEGMELLIPLLVLLAIAQGLAAAGRTTKR